VRDIVYSPDSLLLASISENSRISIYNVTKKYQPIKTIDCKFPISFIDDFPNNNYFSLAFSPDSRLLANISSNANSITIWETANFSLKYNLDLTGSIICKVKFAPNNKDFIVLTSTSRLKFFRLSNGDISLFKDVPPVHDFECLDFSISDNCKFLITSGKDGFIKVFDYFMRGDILPAAQCFLGHYNFGKRVLFSQDVSHIFSSGDFNGIFTWKFFGDNEFNADIEDVYEPVEAKINKRATSAGKKGVRFSLT
jgi:WD40 repeat protein